MTRADRGRVGALLVLAATHGACILDWDRGVGGAGGAGGVGGAGAGAQGGSAAGGNAGVSCEPEGDCSCQELGTVIQCSCDTTGCAFDCSSGEICLVEGCSDCTLDCGANGCCTQEDGDIVCFPGLQTSCDTPCP